MIDQVKSFFVDEKKVFYTGLSSSYVTSGGFTMPELIIWKTEEMNRLRRDMGRMFARVWEDFGMPHLPSPTVGAISVAMIEKADHILIRAEIPGMDPENLRIDASEDRVTIRGSVKDESVTEGKKGHRTEMRYESFTRTLRLPCRITPNKAKATFVSDVLEIVLPKSITESSRPIDIQFK
jgi:HSP20 family protein